MMNLVEEAIIYATVMHQGVIRKRDKIPYILHPMEVAQILSTMTDDQETITAGILHDIVEDTDGTLNKTGAYKELILRVYNRHNTYADVEREISIQATYF